MWWNHGGALDGAAPPLLAFFRGYAEALPVPFGELQSTTLAPGVFWLRSVDAGAAFSLVLWDAAALNVTVPVTLPGLPAGAAYAAREVDIARGALVPLGTLTAPVAFTPPTPGFVLELRATASGGHGVL
jgi:hypothetical protein